MKELALLLGAGLASARLCAACPAEEFPGQFQGRHELAFTSEFAKVIVIDQRHADLKIFIDGATPQWLNGPGDRYGPDFVFVENSGTNTGLCLYALFRHSVAGTFSIAEYPVPQAPDATSLQALASINSAGVSWLGGSSAAVVQSAEQYMALANNPPDALRAIPDFDFYGPYFAAQANIKLRRFDQAWLDLQRIDTPVYRVHPEYYKVLMQQGRIRVRQREWAAGIDLLEAAQTQLQEQEQATGTTRPLEYGEIASYLGEAYIYSRNFDAAQGLLDQAIARSAPDFSMLGRVINNVGLLYAIRSEPVGLSRAEITQLHNASLDNVLTASYFSTEAGDREIAQLIENNIGVQYARMGERRKSLVHFLKVLEMMEDIDNPEFRTFLYSNLGNYTMVLGDYRKARAYLEQAVALGSNGSAGFITNLCRLGTLHRLQADAAGALELHRACLAEAQGAGDMSSQVEALLQISTDFAQEGRYGEAEVNVREGLELLGEAGDINATQRALTQLASILLRQDRVEEAQATISRVLALQVDDRYPNERVAALATAMEAAIRAGAEETARQYGREAIAKIELLYTQLEAERLGPAWSNQTNQVFARVAELDLLDYETNSDPAALARAVDAMERARDISLRQRLASGISTDVATLETQKQLDLYGDISQILASSGETISANSLQLDYYHQHDLLSLARLNHVDSLPVPSPVTLEAISQALTAEQLVLYYQITDGNLHVLALNAGNAEIHRVPLTGTAAALVRDAGAVLHAPADFSAAQLREYAAILLPDLQAYPDVREILIVADGTLHAFPFAALPLGPEENSYTPLIARYSVKSVPSLSAYLMAKAPTPAAAHSADIVVLADPVFERAQLASLDMDPVASGLRGWAETLSALPYTAQEARNIEQRFGGTTVAFTGTEANRSNLVGAEARNARILHIATHGYFRSASDDNVGFALSTVDAAGNAQPAFITLTELFAYKFSNELVVISGCDTALGKAQAGVGFNSLSRGFLAQGVKHVIATLWPVSDRASAEFMGIFYERLQAEKNVTLALQQAQQVLSRNPAYRNPYYWAGYTLTSVTPDAVIGLGD